MFPARRVGLSVGLSLRAKVSGGALAWLGRRQPPDEMLKKMEAWVLEYCADLGASTFLGTRDDQPTLYCKLHPAAEDLEISLVNSTCIEATANTSSVGPGYHVFVCDMLRALGKRFNATWQGPSEEYGDEADYFFSGDREAVFRHMTAWIRALSGLFFDGTLKHQEKIRLAMPLDIGFEWKAEAITPTGPRDSEWLKRTSQNGEAGRDFFSWWMPGLNAEYFLGRALVRMWSEVRWRKPINERERGVLGYVVDSLLTAYRLDPGLNYPWVEWAEMLAFLGRGDAEYDFVRQHALHSQSYIGYRRLDVSVQLPGFWWITLPGTFSDFEADENHNYFALDPPREVWVTSYSFKGDLPKLLESHRAEVREEKPELVHEQNNYISSASIAHKVDNGHEYYLLQAVGAGLGCRAVQSIIFTDPVEREWAIGVWKSLKPPQSPSDQ